MRPRLDSTDSTDSTRHVLGYAPFLPISFRPLPSSSYTLGSTHPLLYVRAFFVLPVIEYLHTNSFTFLVLYSIGSVPCEPPNLRAAAAVAFHCPFLQIPRGTPATGTRHTCTCTVPEPGPGAETRPAALISFFNQDPSWTSSPRRPPSASPLTSLPLQLRPRPVISPRPSADRADKTWNHSLEQPKRPPPATTPLLGFFYLLVTLG